MTSTADAVHARSAAWMQAWVDKDRAVLEDSLAADYALIVSAMPAWRMDRDLWLTTCERYLASSFAYRDVQVREVAPGLAVMSSIADQVARMGDVDRSGAFFLVDVWRVEPDGNWRVCSRHSAHPEPAGASSQALGGLRPD